jgi:putative phosphoesterase
MRLAVIADIHGNLRALEAVQTDLHRHAPDLVLNLGDHLSGPLQAAGAADLLMQSNYLSIRGNHDRQLLDRSPEKMGPSDRAAFAQLTGAHKEWLGSLPATRVLDERILLCHGTPLDDLQYLLEEIHGTETRLRSAEQIRMRLPHPLVSLVLCAHSHIPRVVNAGGVTVLNPGSVGLQAYDATQPVHYMETGSPHARYAVVDREGLGLKINFIAVEYDWEAASQEAAAAGRTDWACALATGYALRT